MRPKIWFVGLSAICLAACGTSVARPPHSGPTTTAPRSTTTVLPSTTTAPPSTTTAPTTTVPTTVQPGQPQSEVATVSGLNVGCTVRFTATNTSDSPAIFGFAVFPNGVTPNAVGPVAPGDSVTAVGTIPPGSTSSTLQLSATTLAGGSMLKTLTIQTPGC
jgi:hypothetical protein